MFETLNHSLFGKAKLVGYFENQSAEWHEVRKGGIGGSQVGTICGLNPWESAYTLWAKLSNRIPDSFEQNEKMFWGTVLEPVIKQIWLSKNPEFELFETGTWADDWRHANPDGILKIGDDYGLLEVKTAGYRWDAVPAQYEAQCQWYMGLLGLKWCKVVVLFQGNQLETFHLDFDVDFFNVLSSRAEQFWLNLQADKAPDWDGSESTYQTVRQEHPEIVEDEIELGSLGLKLVLVQGELEECQAKLNQIKSMVLDYMGKAKYGLVNGRVVATRSSRGGGIPYLSISKKGN